MSRQKGQAASPKGKVLDRAHLGRYTMENPALEREIIKLFVDQLPVTLRALREARTKSEWKLAAHTLKGSAAAVGASHINAIASELEARPFGVETAGRRDLLGRLETAIEQFRKAALPLLG